MPLLELFGASAASAASVKRRGAGHPRQSPRVGAVATRRGCTCKNLGRCTPDSKQLAGSEVADQIICLRSDTDRVRDVHFFVKKSIDLDRQRKETRARVAKFRQKHKVRLITKRQKAASMRLSGTIGRPPVHRCYELFFAEGPLAGLGADVLIVRDGDPLVIPPGLYHEKRWLVSIAVSLQYARSMRRTWFAAFKDEAPPGSQ